MDSPSVWLPLCVLFVGAFFDVRRPARILHLDLLVLLSFGGYPPIFDGTLGGVPLAYPALIYLLVRLLWVGLRPRQRDEPLVPLMRTSWLVIALVVLVAVRIGVNVTEHYVIDTGTSGLIGADRILHGQAIYAPGPHVDTYGPINYLAYVPFALVFGAGSHAFDPAAAHAAAITFDLLVILGLLLLGPRLAAGPAGRRLGVILAFAWAAWPYSLFVLGVNTNDALLAALLVFALLALSSPVRRGVWLGVGAAVKFASLPLAPLFATEPGRRLRRVSPTFVIAFGAVFAACFVPFLPAGGVREVYERTLGFQFGSQTEFGVWHTRPELVQFAVQLGAFGLAVAAAFLPRRRSAVQFAALAGAVLIATQLAAQHWYFFYVAWFAPFAFVALFGGYQLVGREPAPPVSSSAAAMHGNAHGRYAQVQ
jgi:hypothetical protein